MTAVFDGLPARADQAAAFLKGLASPHRLLILCALAIQFILLGLGEAIPGMISGAVTTPYPAAS